MSRLDVSSLAKLSNTLRRLPTELAIEIAKRAAPEITKFAQESFDSSATPYGVPWAPGAEGQKVTLRKSGALERSLVYVAVGTRLRVALGVPYAKYQIGRRPVFPRQGAALPPKYAQAIRAIAAATAREWFAKEARP